MSMVLQSTAQPNYDTVFVIEKQNMSHEIQRAVSGALSPAVNNRRETTASLQSIRGRHGRMRTPANLPQLNMIISEVATDRHAYG